MDAKSKQVLIITTPEKSAKATAEVIKQLTSKGSCIYLTLNKSTKMLQNIFLEQKVNMKNLGFIDATGTQIEETQNIVCAPGPNALTEISIALTRLTDSGKYKYLYIDSVSALLVHNDTAKVQRFIQYIINKATNMGLKIIILVVQDAKSNEVMSLLMQITDKQVKM